MNPLHVAVLAGLRDHGPTDRYTLEQNIPRDPARWRGGGWTKYHLNNLLELGYVEKSKAARPSWADVWSITASGSEALQVWQEAGIGLPAEPFFETDDQVEERCRQRVDAAIARQRGVISDADIAVLQLVVRQTFPAFCGALQRARREGAKPYQMRAAALMVLNNIYWETVCVLTEPSKWDQEAARFLRQLRQTITEGPGRRPETEN